MLTSDDIREIHAIYARYAWAMDDGAVEEWVACWAPDPDFRPASGARYRNRDELTEFAQARQRDWASLGIKTQHWFSNIQVEQDGNGATGRCYALLVAIKDGEAPTLLLGATMADRFVRHDGRWLLKSKTATPDVRPAVTPLPTT